jgi:hypothetical protein
MGLSHEYVGPQVLAKIKINILTRAELLFPLCYEIPCIKLHIIVFFDFWAKAAYIAGA